MRDTVEEQVRNLSLKKMAAISLNDAAGVRAPTKHSATSMLADLQALFDAAPACRTGRGAEGMETKLSDVEARMCESKEAEAEEESPATNLKY